MIESNKYVAIIDYQLSNLFSVDQAWKYVGMTCSITSDYKVIQNASVIILTGVGAFGEAMENINKLGLRQVIIDLIQSETLFMDVCWGMQLLMKESEEFGAQKGLGIIDSVVKRFPAEVHGNKLRVPQISWNTIYAPNHEQSHWDDTPLKSNIQNDYMYFVHSYYVEPKDRTIILSKTEHKGIEYTSGLQYKNIFAFQFHPEKSGNQGLNIYRSFFELMNR